ncbi:MAG TPA: hypothetical protein PKZ38_07865, partial [Dermatophilaceae bacterium]|nr:hypothetical protein [Dermatophilaceae bacterium]
GPGDPTSAADRDGTWWRAFRSPEGTATLALTPGADEVIARAWGAGAGWALDAVPALLGAAPERAEDRADRHGTTRPPLTHPLGLHDGPVSPTPATACRSRPQRHATFATHPGS